MPPIRDVLQYGAVEQHGLLPDHRHSVGPRLRGERVCRHSIEVHAAAVGLVEEGHYGGDGALAAAAAPHQRRHRPGLQHEVNTLEHCFALAEGVAEVHVAQLQRARLGGRHRRLVVARVGQVGVPHVDGAVPPRAWRQRLHHRRLGRRLPQDVLHPGHGGLHHAPLAHRVHHPLGREDEGEGEADAGHEGLQAHVAVGDQPAAQRVEHQQRDVDGQPVDRLQRGLGLRKAQPGAVRLLAVRGEALALQRLARKRAHGADGAERLPRDRRHAHARHRRALLQRLGGALVHRRAQARRQHHRSQQRRQPPGEDKQYRHRADGLQQGTDATIARRIVEDKGADAVQLHRQQVGQLRRLVPVEELHLLHEQDAEHLLPQRPGHLLRRLAEVVHVHFAKQRLQKVEHAQDEQVLSVHIQRLLSRQRLHDGAHNHGGGEVGGGAQHERAAGHHEVLALAPDHAADEGVVQRVPRPRLRAAAGAIGGRSVAGHRGRIHGWVVGVGSAGGASSPGAQRRAGCRCAERAGRRQWAASQGGGGCGRPSARRNGAHARHCRAAAQRT
mmetsp:Transcript_1241/g.2913  ORF Transcript_1241/g.2913 Transcript_1241/m.2913 type:complete len:556 (+) Transcript_1241:670-2337(+)